MAAPTKKPPRTVSKKSAAAVKGGRKAGEGQKDYG